MQLTEDTGAPLSDRAGLYPASVFFLKRRMERRFKRGKAVGGNNKF